MLRQFKHFLILSTCILSACSTVYGPHGVIQNRSKDYLEATQISPLRIPPGLSSSTMQAHYPVSERDYPRSQKEVKLIPPELSSAQLREKSFFLHKEQPITPPTSHPVTQGYTASNSEETTLTPKQQQQAENHYYDAYTRSETGGVGRTMGSILNKIWPFGRKNSNPQPASENTALYGKPNVTGAPIQSTKSIPETTQSPQTGSSASTSAQAVSSSTASSPQATSTPVGASQTPNQSNTNGASQATAQASKMPNMYFDRFTRR